MRDSLDRARTVLRRIRGAVLPSRVERPVNVAYELWDYCLYFAFLASVGYVLNPPPENTRTALSELFDFADPWQWGSLTAVVVLTGAICTYRERWLPTGYLLLIAAATAWTGWFVIGLLAYDAPPRTWVSVIIYANIASRGYRLKERL